MFYYIMRIYRVIWHSANSIHTLRANYYAIYILDAGVSTRTPILHSASNTNALNSILCRCGAPSGDVLSQNALCGVNLARSVSES